MFFIKMMLNENPHDECNDQGFRIIQVTDLHAVVFYSLPSRDGEMCRQIHISMPSGVPQVYDLLDNAKAYVMNESGKTIATFS